MKPNQFNIIFAMLLALLLLTSITLFYAFKLNQIHLRKLPARTEIARQAPTIYLQASGEHGDTIYCHVRMEKGEGE